ncbi:hypothetical protein NEAUS04_1057 [Nematocida ausubeli]|nr:hypothetical protein NEAUS04_1057 [Nematocida ausubeli]
MIKAKKYLIHIMKRHYARKNTLYTDKWSKQRHLLVLGMMILGIAASVNIEENSFFSDSRRKSETPLNRTIRVLKRENDKINTETIKFSIDNDGALEMQNPEERLITVTLSKYYDIKNDIFDFEDALKYTSITIDGSGEGDSKARGELCMQFVHAFRNAKVKTLQIKGIKINKKDLPAINTSKKNTVLPIYNTTVEKIVFSEVSNCLAKRILRHYSFSSPIELVLDTKEPVSWDTLLAISRNKQYKRIEIGKLASLSMLTEKKIKSLEKILTCLVVKELPRCNHAQLQPEIKRIFENSMGYSSHVTVQMYKQLRHSALSLPSDGSDLELFVEGLRDFDIDVDEHTPVLGESTQALCEAEMQELLKDNRSVSISQSYYTSLPSASSNRVILRFMEETPINAAILRKIFIWIGNNMKTASNVTIHNVKMTSVLEEILGSVRVCINSMQHLKHLYIVSGGAKKRKIELRNTSYHDILTASRTFAINNNTCTTGFPASVYITGKMKLKQSQVLESGSGENIIKYPGEATDAISLCTVCILGVFVNETAQNRNKTTMDYLSIQEIEGMTWKDFLESENRNFIEAHLKHAYSVDSEDSITERDFYKMVKHYCNMPIIVFPMCKHSVCAKCLSAGYMHMQEDDHLNLERHKLIKIRCPACREVNIMSTYFHYPVCVTSTYKIPDSHIYQVEKSATSGNLAKNYVFYACEGFRSDEYYRKFLPYSVKTDVVIKIPGHDENSVFSAPSSSRAPNV